MPPNPQYMVCNNIEIALHFNISDDSLVHAWHMEFKDDAAHAMFKILLDLLDSKKQTYARCQGLSV